eukprot:10676779-Lingulodinium_polyedra.AAC.1
MFSRSPEELLPLGWKSLRPTDMFNVFSSLGKRVCRAFPGQSDIHQGAPRVLRTRPQGVRAQAAQTSTR